jgi:SAM-dependent methyltransferase
MVPEGSFGNATNQARTAVTKPIYFQLVGEMEGNLERYGDTFEGVGWTKSQENTNLRYQVMLDLVRGQEPCTLLDLGCGAAHLYDYMVSRGQGHVSYSGLDLSPAYLSLCRSKFPHMTFYEADLMAGDATVPDHDYVLLNGVFNYKSDCSHETMWEYCQSLLLRAWSLTRKGMAFNVVSKHVDWERDDLFHLPIGIATDFVASRLSRRFVVRHDYGLFEYTVYVYRE